MTDATAASARAFREETAAIPFWPVALFCVVIFVPAAFQLGSLHMTPLRVVQLAATLPLAVLLLQGRAGRLLWTDWCLGSYLVWSLIGIAVIHDLPTMVTFGGSTSAEAVGSYLMARVLVRSPETFMRTIRLLTTLLILTVPLALFESLTGREVLIETISSLPGLTSFAPVNNPPRLGLERAQVFMPHPIHYGVFCSMLFALTYLGLRDAVGTVERHLRAAALVLACFLSVSSGAFLAMLLQMGLIGYHLVTRSVSYRWMYLVLLGVLAWCAIWVATGHLPIKVVMSKLTFNPQTAYWRAILFDYGLQNVQDNPIFGIGLNDWERPHWVVGNSLDNFWLLQAMRYGYPGFILIAATFLSAVIAIGRQKMETPELEQLRLAWMIAMVGTIMSLATVHVWTTPFSFLFFLLGMGLWMLDPDARGAGRSAAAPDPAAGAPAGRRRAQSYTRFGSSGPAPAEAASRKSATATPGMTSREAADQGVADRGAGEIPARQRRSAPYSRAERSSRRAPSRSS